MAILWFLFKFVIIGKYLTQLLALTILLLLFAAFYYPLKIFYKSMLRVKFDHAIDLLKPTYVDGMFFTLTQCSPFLIVGQTRQPISIWKTTWFEPFYWSETSLSLKHINDRSYLSKSLYTIVLYVLEYTYRGS